jgi:hypothetical protein
MTHLLTLLIILTLGGEAKHPEKQGTTLDHGVIN